MAILNDEFGAARATASRRPSTDVTRHRPTTDTGSARLLLALLLALSGPRLRAPAPRQADTIGSPRALFTYRDLVLAGSVAAVTMLARPFDDHYAARLQDSSTQANRKLQGLADLRAHDRHAGLVLHRRHDVPRRAGSRRTSGWPTSGCTAPRRSSSASSSAVVDQGHVGRQRPYVRPAQLEQLPALPRLRRRRQIPLLPVRPQHVGVRRRGRRDERDVALVAGARRWIIGPALYGGAALTGISRMYNNRHWASDVLDRRGDRYLRRTQGRTLSPLAPGQPARPTGCSPARSFPRTAGPHAPLVDHARARLRSPRIPPAAETSHRAPRTRVTPREERHLRHRTDRRRRRRAHRRAPAPVRPSARRAGPGAARHARRLVGHGTDRRPTPRARSSSSGSAPIAARHRADHAALRAADALHADADRRAPARPARPPPHAARAHQDERASARRARASTSPRT